MSLFVLPSFKWLWLVGVLFSGLKLAVTTGLVCSAVMVGGVDESHTAVACKKCRPSRLPRESQVTAGPSVEPNDKYKSGLIHEPLSDTHPFS